VTAIFLHIATPAGGRIAAALARACARAGVTWSCFLTNDGVRALADSDVVAALKPAARVAVCEHSWRQHMNDAPCPVELGSQTINSALMAEAGRVVSL
jgi:hypothetical protein